MSPSGIDLPDVGEICPIRISGGGRAILHPDRSCHTVSSLVIAQLAATGKPPAIRVAAVRDRAGVVTTTRNFLDVGEISPIRISGCGRAILHPHWGVAVSGFLIIAQLAGKAIPPAIRIARVGHSAGVSAASFVGSCGN